MLRAFMPVESYYTYIFKEKQCPISPFFPGFYMVLTSNTKYRYSFIYKAQDIVIFIQNFLKIF